jgi:hypothetical protein
MNNNAAAVQVFDSTTACVQAIITTQTSNTASLYLRGMSHLNKLNTGNGFYIHDTYTVRLLLLTLTCKILCYIFFYITQIFIHTYTVRLLLLTFSCKILLYPSLFYTDIYTYIYSQATVVDTFMQDIVISFVTLHRYLYIHIQLGYCC